MDLGERIVSAEYLSRMKGEQQARDRELAASGAVDPVSMLLIRPEHFRRAKIDWPTVSLIDDGTSKQSSCSFLQAKRRRKNYR